MKTTKKELTTAEKINNGICKNHSGKMAGMISLSTACSCNEICKARAKVPGCICEHCYAETLIKMRKSLREKLERNTELLTAEIIPVEDFPIINASFFRLEAFGDLNNTIQAINYINFSRRNPQTIFGWWTKNVWFVKRALEQLNIEKPENIVLIYSSPKVNYENEKLLDLFRVNGKRIIDKLFTVYDKKYIAENNVEINCGARNCLTCLQCYNKNTATLIHEHLK